MSPAFVTVLLPVPLGNHIGLGWVLNPVNRRPYKTAKETQTHTGGGPMKMGVVVGMMQLQSKELPSISGSHWKLKEAGKLLPESHRREHSPAHSLIWGLWPPELMENNALLI